MNSKNDQLVEGYNPVYLVFVSDDFFFLDFERVLLKKSAKITKKSQKYTKNQAYGPIMGGSDKPLQKILCPLKKFNSDFWCQKTAKKMAGEMFRYPNDPEIDMWSLWKVFHNIRNKKLSDYVLTIFLLLSQFSQKSWSGEIWKKFFVRFKII